MYNLKSVLFSPYPAIPPNVVRRLHIHGARTTADNYSGALNRTTEVSRKCDRDHSRVTLKNSLRGQEPHMRVGAQCCGLEMAQLGAEEPHLRQGSHQSNILQYAREPKSRICDRGHTFCVLQVAELGAGEPHLRQGSQFSAFQVAQLGAEEPEMRQGPQKW